MRVTKRTPIDWKQAMDRLSVGAFFLLNVIWRKDVDINDNTLMLQTGYKISTHRKQKRELLDWNYITIEQVGRGVYLYTVGENV